MPNFKKMILSSKILIKLWIPLLLSAILVSCHSKNADYKFGLKLYVSANGNDSWSGTLREPNPDLTDGPFATITGARDAIRDLKTSNSPPNGNIMIEFNKGVYEFSKPFDLEAIDGGRDCLFWDFINFF